MTQNSVQTELKNYYNPESTMKNAKCQVLYTQPMGSSLLNLSKSNKSFEAITSPKFINKTTEKLPNSLICPTNNEIRPAQKQKSHIQNVKVFKTSSNVMMNASPLIKFQTNAKISNNKTNGTPNIAQQQQNKPFKTMDSSEKNASKRSTKPSQQFSVSGMLSLFGNGRRTSSLNKHKKGSNMGPKNQINFSIQSPNAENLAKIGKARSPYRAHLNDVTRFNDQQKHRTMQSPDAFITRLNNECSPRKLSHSKTRRHNQYLKSSKNISNIVQSNVNMIRSGQSSHCQNTQIQSPNRLNDRNLYYRTEAQPDPSSPIRNQISPQLKVSCEKMTKASSFNKVVHQRSKQNKKQAMKQMAIIQNNVKFNQTMMRESDLTSKMSHEPVQSAFVSVNIPQSMQLSRQKFSEEPQKSIDQSTMTQNTMSFGSFYQISNEPQFGIIKNSRDLKSNGYIMPKYQDKNQDDQQQTVSSQEIRVGANPPKQSMQITTKPSSYRVNKNQQASNQYHNNTKILDLSDIQKARLVETINNDRKNDDKNIGSKIADNFNPYINLEDARKRLSATVPMAVKTRPICETPGGNQSLSAVFDSDGEEFSVPIETEKLMERDRNISWTAVKVQYLNRASEYQIEKEKYIDEERFNEDRDAQDDQNKCGANEKVEQIFINLHQGQQVPPYESTCGNLATSDLDEQRNFVATNLDQPAPQPVIQLQQVTTALKSGFPIISSKSSSTIQMHEWADPKAAKASMKGPLDTETIEFQRNEAKCQETFQREKVDDRAQSASLLIAASQQIKIDQQSSNRPSVNQKDASPDELLNKNIVELTQVKDQSPYLNVHSRPVQLTSPSAVYKDHLTPPNAALLNSQSDFEQTIFRVSSQAPNTARLAQQNQQLTPSNFEDVIVQAKKSEVVQKKSRNPLNRIAGTDPVREIKEECATQPSNKLKDKVDKSPRQPANLSSLILNTTRPSQSGKQINAKASNSGGRSALHIQLKQNTSITRDQSKDRKKIFIHDVYRRVNAQSKSKEQKKFKAVETNKAKVISPVRLNRQKRSTKKAPDGLLSNQHKIQEQNFKKQSMISKSSSNMSNSILYQKTQKKIESKSRIAAKNSDVFNNNHIANPVSFQSPSNIQSINRGRDLFMDIAPKDSRKSTPDRFVSYKANQFLDNSPGLIRSDGEKLADIQEECDSQNKSTQRLGPKNSSLPSQKNSMDIHSSNRQKSQELQNSLMALNKQDIHSDQYWDQIDQIHKQIYLDNQQQQNLKMNKQDSSGPNSETYSKSALVKNYMPQNTKLKYSKSFVDKVTRGLGLNLRNSEEFDALEKASQDLYEKFVENNNNIKRNTGTLQYTTEDEQIEVINLNDSASKTNQGAAINQMQSSQNLKLLNQSFLTNLTNSKSNAPHSGQVTAKGAKQKMIFIEQIKEDVDYKEVASPIDKSPLINGSIEISLLNSSKDFALSKSVDKKFKNAFDVRMNHESGTPGVDDQQKSQPDLINAVDRNGTNSLNSQLVLKESKRDSRLRSIRNQSPETIKVGYQISSSPQCSDSNFKNGSNNLFQQSTKLFNYKEIHEISQEFDNRVKMKDGGRRIFFGKSATEQEDGQQDGEETDGTNLHSDYN